MFIVGFCFDIDLFRLKDTQIFYIFFVNGAYTNIFLIQIYPKNNEIHKSQAINNINNTMWRETLF